MKRNEIIPLNDHYYRVLQIEEESCLVIDCNGKSMPIWKPVETFGDASTITDEDFVYLNGFCVCRGRYDSSRAKEGNARALYHDCTCLIVHR